LAPRPDRLTAQEFADHLRSGPVRRWEDVGVDVERHRHLAVPELASTRQVSVGSRREVLDHLEATVTEHRELYRRLAQ
jgi:hypothetical protein